MFASPANITEGSVLTAPTTENSHHPDLDSVAPNHLMNNMEREARCVNFLYPVLREDANAQL